MAEWTSRDSDDLGPGQIATTITANALYDNPIAIAEGAAGAPRIKDAAIDWSDISGSVGKQQIGSSAVGQSELTNSAVGQSELKTARGSVSGDGNRTLPGGQYGFYPEVDANSNNQDFQIGLGLGGTNTTNIYISASGQARQRYIQSSPPYDLGDGEAGLFVEVDVRPDKSIGGVYIAPDPVWANNGPTDIRPDWQCPKTGKKYKRIRRPTLCREDLEAGRCDMADFVAAQKEAPVEDVEIDGAYKNADMAVIPHSWGSEPQGTICLLDPVNTHDLLALHDAGEDIADLIHKGYIKLGDPCKRCGPPGVTAIGFAWKKAR